MHARHLLLPLVIVAGCNLPPPTTVTVKAVNGRGNVEYPELPAATAKVQPAALAKDTLTPVCDVRGGKTASDGARLAKVMAGVASWQKLGNKTPPSPPPGQNANQGPVTVTGSSVTVRVPGLSGGKRATDLDPRWFAVSCEGGKITATLDDEAMDLDTLYVEEMGSSPELTLAGYSLKSKGVILAKLNTSPRPPKSVPNTSFLVYDLSHYLGAPVEDVTVQSQGTVLAMYFLESGKTAGVQLTTQQFGDRVKVGRFTVGAPAAKK